MFDRRSRRAPVWLIAFLCGAATIASGRVAAQDVVIDRGSLDLLDARSIGSGNLFIGGTRGFTFRGMVDNRFGELEPEVCALGCAPGTVVGIGARWGGEHLPGMVTFDGDTHPVGDVEFMSVEFAGSIVVPDAPEGASLDVPFSFAGVFSAALQSWVLSGAGTATVVLQPSVNGLQVAHITYSFGPISLPDSWFSTGTSEVPISFPTTMFTSGMFVVGGMGDFWGTIDSGWLAARPVSGDAQIVARVRDQSSTHPFAKAGVMLRQSVNESAAHVILDLKPDGGIEFMARRAAREPTEYLAGAVAPVPDPWLKLVRTGDLVTGWLSADGIEWMEVGSIVIPMSPDIIAALAVSSHSFSVVNTAIFDEVAVLPEDVAVNNLLFDGGFEVAQPPELDPWWTVGLPVPSDAGQARVVPATHRRQQRRVLDTRVSRLRDLHRGHRTTNGHVHTDHLRDRGPARRSGRRECERVHRCARERRATGLAQLRRAVRHDVHRGRQANGSASGCIRPRRPVTWSSTT